MPKSRPPYPAAFRQQMVELVRSGRTPGDLAREFEPSAEAIRNWVAQADRDAGKRSDGLRTEEHEEIRRLRRENRRLREEREILANPSAGVPVPVATETRRSRIVAIDPRGAAVSLLVARPRGKRGPRTPADLQVVTPRCDPV